MKSTIRCCISCILPCGALDVIRIVHVNGRVEEITGTIYAAEILRAHPKHILKKPTTKPISEEYIFDTASAHHRPTIVVVPPDAQLQRGKIYFLIPDTNRKTHHHPKSIISASADADNKTVLSASARRRRKEDQQHHQHQHQHQHQHHQQQPPRRSKKVGRSGGSSSSNSNNSSKDDDEYLSEILSEKVSSQKERRRGRVAVWRPHLESITETFSDAASNTNNDQS